MGEQTPDEGEITLGPSIKPGYYAQEFDTLDPALSLLETICKAGSFSEPRGVAFLKKFLFSYDQRDTLVGALSGGERARLQIALITLSGANFLLLDEPTQPPGHPLLRSVGGCIAGFRRHNPGDLP